MPRGDPAPTARLHDHQHRVDPEAYQSSSHLLDYAITKGGIVTFTNALAEDVAGQGVRVNAVAPGPIWTPLIPSTMPADKVKSFGADTRSAGPASPPTRCGLRVLRKPGVQLHHR